MGKNPTVVVDYDAVPQIDWARLAAYVDSEGCIRILANSSYSGPAETYHGVQIIVAQREEVLCKWIQATFGGWTTRSKEVKGKTTMNYWRVSSKASGEILKRILPYLLVKREQAEIAIEYRETTGRMGTRVPPEILLKREELRLRLHALKHGHKAKVEFLETTCQSLTV